MVCAYLHGSGRETGRVRASAQHVVVDQRSCKAHIGQPSRFPLHSTRTASRGWLCLCASQRQQPLAAEEGPPVQVHPTGKGPHSQEGGDIGVRGQLAKPSHSQWLACLQLLRARHLDSLCELVRAGHSNVLGRIVRAQKVCDMQDCCAPPALTPIDWLLPDHHPGENRKNIPSTICYLPACPSLGVLTTTLPLLEIGTSALAFLPTSLPRTRSLTYQPAPHSQS